MAKQGKLQTFLEYAAARSVLVPLGHLPPSIAMTVGRSMGKIAYLLASDLRRTGAINLRLAFPEKTDEERAELLRECFASLGRQLGLFSQLSTRPLEQLQSLIEPHGLEHLEAAKANMNSGGLILFTAHLGAWELTSFGPSLFGHPFSFLVRRIDNPKIEQLVDRTRIRFGNETIDKLSAARSMLKLLRSNGVLGLLPDLNALDSEAIFVDFFGVPAATNFIMAKLALRTKSPIIPVFAPWNEEKGKYQMIVGPPVSFEPTGNEEEDVRALTTTLARFIEDQIRRYPGQWLWIHKRWKTRPKGEPAIY
ncbi:MAG TPA: lysophospholipid acyltransferase family protein [Pyrinomonadaceae bacterium]|nr:lysophospholipid acyltransferase family protein [Pyrinomonadaceae bacterium]